jgi:transposase
MLKILTIRVASQKWCNGKMVAEEKLPMKMPAHISPWLSDEELAAWVRDAPTQDAYKKRLAIWLTRRGPFHAHKVSELLQVSKQAVWLWIKQYNQGGPDSLDRKGRGGRRRAYLSLDQERALVERLQSQVAKGQARKAKELLPEVLEAVGQNVSVAYVYRLMQRHERRRGPATAKPVRKLDGETEMPAMPAQPAAALPVQNPM